MYYRNAQAALVVYDLTKPTSLIKAKHWVAELQRQASPGIVIALVGNKLDLCTETSEDGEDVLADPPAATSAATDRDEDDDIEQDTAGDNTTTTAATAAAEQAGARKVPTREAKAYAEEESLLFFETSAKTGINVNDVFTAIANAIPEKELKTAKTVTGRATGDAISSANAGNGSGTVNLTDRAKQQKDSCAC